MTEEHIDKKHQHSWLQREKFVTALFASFLIFFIYHAYVNIDSVDSKDTVKMSLNSIEPEKFVEETLIQNPDLDNAFINAVEVNSFYMDSKYTLA